jgi:hypothetical protein
MKRLILFEIIESLTIYIISNIISYRKHIMEGKTMNRTLRWIKFESLMIAISAVYAIGLSKFNNLIFNHLNDVVGSYKKRYVIQFS